MSMDKNKNTYGLKFDKEPENEFSSIEIGVVDFPWGKVKVTKGGKKAWSDRDGGFYVNCEDVGGNHGGAFCDNQLHVIMFLNELARQTDRLAMLVCERVKLEKQMEPLQVEHLKVGRQITAIFSKEVA